jgi:serine/threonine-protein kinase
LLDKYEVESVIGAGGMGVVVAARHLILGQRVALKFLRNAGSERPEIVTRFFREAQAAAKIQGEHVARVFDVGRLPSGVPFLVMEYLAGRDLAEVLRTEGPLPIERAVTYVLEACEALAQAHALGIIHRDLKPGNLFLVRSPDGAPFVKVLDFGISKSVSADGSSETLTGPQGILGSPLYMSPEQIRSSKTVDARSDVWSLGVILHELLAGRPPFEGDGAPSVFASIAADPPVPLQSVAPHVPAALAALVARCLEKSPDARPASVGELARGLLPFAPAEGRGSVDRITTVLGQSGATTIDPTSSLGHADTIHAATPPPLGTGTDWGRTGERRAPRSPSRPSPLAAAALLAVLAGVGVVLVLRPATRAVEAPSSASAPAVDAAAPPPPASTTAPPAAPAESTSAPAPSASATAAPRRSGTRPAPPPLSPPTPTPAGADLHRTEF